MAATELDFPYTVSYAITCTWVADSSADYGSIPTDKRFYDKALKMPLYKDADGNVHPVYNDPYKQDKAVNVQSVVSAATVTPTSSNEFVKITAQAEALIIANPTGTFGDGQPFLIYVKDNGTSRAVSWGNKYLAFNSALLAATTLGKATVIPVIYNSTLDKFMALQYQTEV